MNGYPLFPKCARERAEELLKIPCHLRPVLLSRFSTRFCYKRAFSALMIKFSYMVYAYLIEGCVLEFPEYYCTKAEEEWLLKEYEDYYSKRL
jgi:hypothetical protein